MSTDFFVMMHEAPWAGPAAFRIDGPEISLGRGRRLEEDPGAFAFELRVDPGADPAEFPPLDLHYPPPALPLFSKRMKTVLAAAGVDNIDYYPATVTYQPTGGALAYELANVIGVAEGVDRERSTFEASETGVIEVFSKLALDESKFRGRHMTRLYELLRLLIVSRRVKDAIETAGLTGILIVSDDEWEPGMI